MSDQLARHGTAECGAGRGRREDLRRCTVLTDEDERCSFTTASNNALHETRLADAAQIARVGLPRIGAGLGGLAWPTVRALLATIAATTSVELIVFD